MHDAGAHRHTDGGRPAQRPDSSGTEIWDVAIVGGGPAGLAAARVAAAAGARTVVLERAEHPRYKTCGGGLIGASLAALAGHVKVPAREHIDSVTFTYHGRWGLTRRVTGAPALAMVCRDEFDAALRSVAVEAGAVVRERVAVRGLSADGGHPTVRLADGSTVTARIVIGADGSSGVCAPYVGVTYDQVDLGLELELPVEGPTARRWRGRVLLDWGHIPGSYAWVFPKGDKLTVGVIASRGTGSATRDYLAGFRHRLGLDGVVPERDSGHLTRCRSVDSPLRRGASSSRAMPPACWSRGPARASASPYDPGRWPERRRPRATRTHTSRPYDETSSPRWRPAGGYWPGSRIARLRTTLPSRPHQAGMRSRHCAEAT